MTESRSFTISHWAHVEAYIDEIVATSFIEISKRGYQKPRSVARVSLTEWNKLSAVYPELMEKANEMQTYAKRINDRNAQRTRSVEGEEQEAMDSGVEGAEATPEFTSAIQKLLTEDLMMSLNVFHAPNGNAYVTLGIRRYFKDSRDGSLKMKKDNGVTLNYADLLSMEAVIGDVNSLIAQRLATTRVVKLVNGDEVMAAKRIVDDFYHFGSGRCRLVLEKLV